MHRLRPDGSVPVCLLLGPVCQPLSVPADVQDAVWTDLLTLEGGEARPDRLPRAGRQVRLPAWVRTTGPAARAWRTLEAGADGVLRLPVWPDWFAGAPKWFLAAFYFSLYRAADVVVEVGEAEKALLFVDGSAVVLPGAALRGSVQAAAGRHFVMIKAVAGPAGPAVRVRVLRADGSPLRAARIALAPRPGRRVGTARRGRRRPADLRAPRESFAPPIAEGRTEPGEADWADAALLTGLASEGGWAERRPTDVRVCYGPSSLFLRVLCPAPPGAAAGGPPWLGDHVRIAFDPEHAHEEVRILLLGQNGAWQAFRRTAEGEVLAWDGPSVRIAPRNGGWQAEVALPLPPAMAGATVGLNVLRSRPDTADGYCVWSPPAAGRAGPWPALPPWLAASLPGALGHVQLWPDADGTPRIERAALSRSGPLALSWTASLVGGAQAQRPTLRLTLAGARPGAGPVVESAVQPRVPRLDAVEARCEIRPLPTGPSRLRVALSPTTSGRLVQVGSWPVPSGAVLEPDLGEVVGGWLLGSGRSAARAARLSIAARDSFTVPFGALERTPWPWLVYLDADERDVRVETGWNAAPLVPVAPGADGSGRRVLAARPEAVRARENDLMVRCEQRGACPSFRLRSIRVVRGEDRTVEGRTVVTRLPAWRAVGGGAVLTRLLPCESRPGLWSESLLMAIPRGGRVAFPFLADPAAADMAAGVSLRLVLCACPASAAPAAMGFLNGSPLPAPAREDEVRGATRATVLTFAAPPALLVPGVCVFEAAFGPPPPRSVWWIRGLTVMMETGRGLGTAGLRTDWL